MILFRLAILDSGLVAVGGSREISDLDIEVARHKWIIRRSRGRNSLLLLARIFSREVRHSELVDRRVYVAYTVTGISDKQKCL